MLTAKRENPMSKRSKNALSGALLKLMMEKDYKDIAISDITEKAGLSRQTFYTNFIKKEDILVYLVKGLFVKYSDRLIKTKPKAEDLLVDYFIYWSESRDFLSLIFKQDMGYIFQDLNRSFFLEETESLNDMFSAEEWQLPYIKASLAGLTYELFRIWITEEQGLSVTVLTALAQNLLGGRLFSEIK